jgi:hypothetical protein
MFFSIRNSGNYGIRKVHLVSTKASPLCPVFVRRTMLLKGRISDILVVEH